MSSSAKLPYDWNVFKPREEVEVEILTSPIAAVGALLNERQNVLLEKERRSVQEREAWLEALAQQAILVTQLEKVLNRYKAVAEQEQQTPLAKFYRSLNILKKQMAEKLQQAKIEIEEPLGKAPSEVVDVVEIMSWLPQANLTTEQVIEVHEPIVRYQGQLLHKALVVMGMPAETGEMLATQQDAQR